jgi:hypothetical protein
VRQSVAARLGFEPFSSEAPLRIDARIAPGTEGLRGELTVVDANGAKRVRELSSRTGDCLELASAMELAIAIVIDPQYLLRPAPRPPAPGTSPPKVAEAAPVTPPQPPRVTAAPIAGPPPGPAIFATAGAHLAGGLAPTPVLGAFGGAAFRWPGWSFALEARADLPGAVAFGEGGGEVAGSVLLGSAAVCARFGVWAGCGFASAGALQVTGRLAAVVRKSSPLVLGGFRGEVEAYRTGPFAVRPFLELQAVLTRTTVTAADQQVWVAGPLAGRLGIATEFELLR